MAMTDDTGQDPATSGTMVPAPPVGLSGHGSNRNGASPGAPFLLLFPRDDTNEDWAYGCGAKLKSPWNSTLRCGQPARNGVQARYLCAPCCNELEPPYSFSFIWRERQKPWEVRVDGVAWDVEAVDIR